MHLHKGSSYSPAQHCRRRNNRKLNIDRQRQRCMEVYTLHEIMVMCEITVETEGLKLGDFAIVAYNIIVKVHVQLTSD